ncbi:DUF3617 family protein [Altererythrobacter aurantiacus]|uniref:DUF3617 family protein n=1 Tax=Parapontixanthobacter aurantiacus TaxID=1463599 RepID=A0A844ZDE7_9SPHN|nr:DUF3617 family protein [Parapontixanthobacter aurantiacus]MXO85788.1 DUF3617 family protein [Parapontixanthobacter aurantiacus]
MNKTNSQARGSTMALATGLALVLAACGSADEAETDPALGGDTAAASGEALSDDELIAAGREITRPEPGQYRSEVELVNVDIPGAPQAQVDMMRRMFADSASTTTEYCITPEDAERGFEEMVRGGQRGDCEFQKFDTAGGNIDAAMTCQHGQGTANITMQGEATATTSDMTMTMRQDGGEMGRVSMTMNVKHRRIGDCPA